MDKHSAIKPIAEENDLRIYKKRPTVRVMAGLFLILISYVIGWPAVGALGIIALYTGKPLILVVGGPLMYGLSHLVFFIGMYFAGRDYAVACLKQVMKFLRKTKQNE